MRRERVEQSLEGVGGGRRVAIVAARFYADLADQLIDGARRALRAAGVAEGDVRVVDVPGCFELPLAAQKLAGAGFDAVVALGVVIRGETPHFDFVAGECARGIMDVQLRTGVPVGFGVLTTENRPQAEERADPERGDKGFEAAVAALALLALES
ncbi:MAG TPA: 6,7-dimethyl-8-ribityllumazine synthase [Candidatus Dormibacteraeota bacterium]|nr:6,7-dimethyl-8-ribityllumazine synthase [Candidatus Dormibacteraeota bacterium]